MQLRECFLGIPVLAMTATASPSTMTQIIDLLNLKSPTTIVVSPDRAEIYLEVRKHPRDDDAAYGHLVHQLSELGISCTRHIIYVQVRTINRHFL